MGKKVIGYTTGVFDLFHIGHLNILKKAKQNCDKLIVGVTTDELCEEIKGRKPIIPFIERMEIVRSIKYVDEVTPEMNRDKVKALDSIVFNRIFKGSDWRGTPIWNDLEKEFKKVNVEVMYFDYTDNTSSTLIRNVLTKLLHND